MQNHNLYALFQSRFPADETAAFIETPDGETILYKDIDRLSGHFLGLFEKLGLQAGERVIVQVSKSPAAMMLYLACLRHGLIYIPLNTAYTVAEVEYFARDAEPALIVGDPAREAEFNDLRDRLGIANLFFLDSAGNGSLMEAALAERPLQHTIERGADDLAAILYTSGTTGRSKGAMLSHDNLASNALTLHKIWGWRPGDVLLHALPIFHVHGLFVASHCALLNGSKMLFLPKFDLEQIIELLPQATVMMGVPTFYTRLLGDERFTRDLCRNMRLFISGSAPLLPETFRAFEKRTGMAILERYGMTEAGMITSNPLEGERIPGTVGFPLPGVDLRIADENGTPLPANEIGVLEFKGPNLFKGYWRMPEKTAEEFRDDGFFISGDLASQDETGRVSIVGRAKDLIISGGFNIYPKEIELLIDELPGIDESAVIGVPHPDFGEGVVAVVVPKDGAAPSEEDILAALKDKLARFKQPKRIFFTDELPRNTMGKVQKAVLRETYKDSFKG